MKAIFLGTNGWYDTDTGNTICVLIRTAGADIIFDAGNGLYKVDRYIPESEDREVYLFLSHFHLDHIAGLHTLAKFRFARGLTICGPAATREILHTIINAPFTVPLQQLPYPVRIHELPEELDKIPLSLETRPLRHASLTLGYRLEADGRVVSYCPDTGYCENAVLLAKSADLLIAECAYRSGDSDENWPHLNPETAARIATEAQVKRLALVHFDASTHSSLSDRRASEQMAQSIFPNTFAARDDMQVEV